MLKNIVIIGAGSVGSRHLQAIKRSSYQINIYVIDKSINSLKIAKKRYNEINYNSKIKNIIFSRNISDCPTNIFLLINATTASVRYKSTKPFIEKFKIKYIIFEKFLFSKVDEIVSMKELLKTNKIKAWVNCNYQMIPFFKKKKFFNSSKLTMNVHGGKWAFASSSIHFIELFCFLTNEPIYKIQFEPLGEKISKSKRIGYSEFGGIITAKTKKNDFLIIESRKDSNKPLHLDLSNKYFYFKFDISKRKAILDDYSKNVLKRKNFKIYFPMQSELSNIYLDNIIKNKDCGLPTYQDCSTNHLKLIKLFNTSLFADERYKNRKNIIFT